MLYYLDSIKSFRASRGRGHIPLPHPHPFGVHAHFLIIFINRAPPLKNSCIRPCLQQVTKMIPIEPGGLGRQYILPAFNVSVLDEWEWMAKRLAILENVSIAVIPQPHPYHGMCLHYERDTYPTSFETIQSIVF